MIRPLLIAVALIAQAPKDRTVPDPLSPPPAPLGVGDDAMIRPVGSEAAPAGRTYGAASDYLKFEKAGDRDGTKALLHAKQAFPLASGVRVRLLEATDYSSIGRGRFWEVRVLSGPHEGETCFVQAVDLETPAGRATVTVPLADGEAGRLVAAGPIIEKGKVPIIFNMADAGIFISSMGYVQWGGRKDRDESAFLVKSMVSDLKVALVPSGSRIRMVKILPHPTGIPDGPPIAVVKLLGGKHSGMAVGTLPNYVQKAAK